MQKEFLTELGITDENAEMILQKNTEEIVNIKKRHAVESALSKKGVKNLDAAMKLFDMDSILVENGEFVGLKENIEKFSQDNDFLFQTEQIPIFSAPTGNDSDNIISREEFSKMGYTKRLKLFNENPQRYKDLCDRE